MCNVRPEVQQCRMTGGSAHLQLWQQQVVTSPTTFSAKCNSSWVAIRAQVLLVVCEAKFSFIKAINFGGVITLAWDILPLLLRRYPPFIVDTLSMSTRVKHLQQHSLVDVATVQQTQTMSVAAGSGRSKADARACNSCWQLPKSVVGFALGRLAGNQRWTFGITLPPSGDWQRFADGCCLQADVLQASGRDS